LWWGGEWNEKKSQKSGKGAHRKKKKKIKKSRGQNSIKKGLWGTKCFGRRGKVVHGGGDEVGQKAQKPDS